MKWRSSNCLCQAHIYSAHPIATHANPTASSSSACNFLRVMFSVVPCGRVGEAEVRDIWLQFESDHSQQMTVLVREHVSSLSSSPSQMGQFWSKAFHVIPQSAQRQWAPISPWWFLCTGFRCFLGILKPVLLALPPWKLLKFKSLSWRISDSDEFCWGSWWEWGDWRAEGRRGNINWTSGASVKEASFE